ncbi:MAG: SPASM domain-containing protein, partial [Muribaculaceae bacterium]|nr:SPASM domain-containing protein [Muribaculaceae bacterium]
IDPIGRIYRCWEHIGNEKYSVGEIVENGKAIFKTSNLVDALLSISDPLRIEKCKNCCFLPMCYGGCPVERYYTTGKQDCIIEPDVFDNLIKCHLEYIFPTLEVNSNNINE